jgi:hypothetical protein
VHGPKCAAAEIDTSNVSAASCKRIVYDYDVGQATTAKRLVNSQVSFVVAEIYILKKIVGN